MLLPGSLPGGPLGLLRQLERHPEDIDQAIVDQLAEVMLGIPSVRLAALPLPGNRLLWHRVKRRAGGRLRE